MKQHLAEELARQIGYALLRRETRSRGERQYVTDYTAYFSLPLQDEEGKKRLDLS